MSMRDNYRTRAAEFHARARMESDEGIRRQYESLAKQYSRLAERVDHDAAESDLRATAAQNFKFK
jgi:hypothetical protein